MSEDRCAEVGFSKGIRPLKSEFDLIIKNIAMVNEDASEEWEVLESTKKPRLRTTESNPQGTASKRELRERLYWYPGIKTSVHEYWEIFNSFGEQSKPNPEFLFFPQNIIHYCQQNKEGLHPGHPIGLGKDLIKLSNLEAVCPWDQNICPCKDAQETIAQCGMHKGC